jgi:hypothetical protein
MCARAPDQSIGTLTDQVDRHTISMRRTAISDETDSGAERSGVGYAAQARAGQVERPFRNENITFPRTPCRLSEELLSAPRSVSQGSLPVWPEMSA